jgi:hypothetical protein
MQSTSISLLSLQEPHSSICEPGHLGIGQRCVVSLNKARGTAQDVLYYDTLCTSLRTATTAILYIFHPRMMHRQSTHERLTQGNVSVPEKRQRRFSMIVPLSCGSYADCARYIYY